MNTKNLLLIFTRNPELGKGKTRLAATVGKETALEIYKFLLARTVEITENLDLTKQVYYSETIWDNDIWENSIYQKRVQCGENLGKRMINAFKDGFETGFEKIIIIGSDMFDLSQADIENAFTQLNDNDFVIGPAEDGGYYLLGMKHLETSVFENKDWGTESVLDATLSDLKNKKIKLLEERNDVDVYEDIKDISAFQPFLKNLE
ncbi:TIGR04282 family arsenosugar biosynthesis glycosyltransferase [Cellulophaga baltica]|uniref:TIGR04282 family arsenosugar biosynthesis glycosyltransferase n=1 Tax=Cellulophaga TaxID=104264 RepID=UPI001C076350|nr:MULTISPECIES: TIGR04282 family arsenosugar biosynthesis glycosyltransferase [Cellulophaga]MBU2995478.1 TIGR04282 family arsenosugar biosynthesis glycosyltransferase [Cellulophaga baltica]MDO6766872.1 TIGR04282 family arsenosugar biosynthesis glycosyltransferase [Cellulophaga sp. 1_MG-2023]